MKRAFPWETNNTKHVRYDSSGDIKAIIVPLSNKEHFWAVYDTPSEPIVSGLSEDLEASQGEADDFLKELGFACQR